MSTVPFISIAHLILSEFDREMASTRKVLERVPEEKAAWKPHEKSFALGTLAIHVASLPYWGVVTFTQTEFDLHPPDGQRFDPPKFESTEAMLATFDGFVAQVREAIANTSDEEMMTLWTLKKGGREFFSMPRIASYRSFVMNHIIHHRAQLTVYLRMNDVPLPNLYGPTADSPI